MSNRKDSPSRVLLVAAAALPLVGLGYIAGNQGLLGHLKVQLEAEFAGVGAAYARRPVGGLRETSMMQLPAAAAGLFLTKGKGPRADSLIDQPLERATTVPKIARPLLAATSTFSSPTRDQISAGERSGIDAETVRRADVPQPIPASTSKSYVRLAQLDAAQGGAHIAGSPSASAFIAHASYASYAAYGPVATSDSADERPPHAGLSVKQAMVSGKGKHKFFGGLTEREFRAKEIRCLSMAIYHEARGEPLKGQQAAAQTIMNRVRSHYYPDTVCGVVYQGSYRRTGCQFSFACDRRSDTPRDKQLWQASKTLATKVADGKVWLPDIGYASHYHATYVKPKWRKYMKRIKRIGVHIFYRAKFLPVPIEVAASSK